MRLKPPPEDCVYTKTGKAIDPAEITIDEICLEDIAYALAGIYRYTGHSRISVATHSLAVAEAVEMQTRMDYDDNGPLVRSALMHDAAEAYFGDVALPLKRYMKKDYHDAVARCEDLIYEKYDLELHCNFPLIRTVDLAIVRYEMERGPGYPEEGTAPLNVAASYALWLATKHAEKCGGAEKAFLQKCKELGIKD